jgi:tRNA-2-methylthio-N6-dimethylallyladenosine synthase
MNSHDSERIAGLLEGMGLSAAPAYEPKLGEPGLTPADVVVINTCAVREHAETRLYGTLGHLASLKKDNPAMQIAVGGCLAQKDRGQILERAPWVDVVFGTHNVGSLPTLLASASLANEAQIEIKESLEAFPSDLPVRRAAEHSAWVSISVGCNNTCSFCIVPSLRGRERDRSLSDVMTEVEALVAEGVVEITLLGQNVNSYGVEFGDKQAFSKLLRLCGQIEGLQRVRFTSPHPKDFTDDVIEAMAETSNVMEHLHMPLQSGSNRVLQLMRRSYRRDRYLGILHKVRAAMPGAAISTDIIVGFPGETEADFQDTLSLVKEARFSTAFTFKYSKRPGTSAVSLPAHVDPEVVAERYQRLVSLVDQSSLEENRKKIGETVEVMVGAGPSRRDISRNRQSGRARDNRLVHFSPGGIEGTYQPGDLVKVEVSDCSPFFLIADGPITSHTKPRLRQTKSLPVFVGS